MIRGLKIIKIYQTEKIEQKKLVAITNLITNDKWELF